MHQFQSSVDGCDGCVAVTLKNGALRVQILRGGAMMAVGLLRAAIPCIAETIMAQIHADESRAAGRPLDA